MRRLALASESLLAGLAAITLVGCSSGVTGSGSGHASDLALTTSPIQASPAPPGSADSALPSTSTSTSVLGTTTAGGSSKSPAFVSVTLTCVVTGHVSFPGESNIATYQPQLSWQLKNATGMALSIDNPGLIGAYGTFSSHGSITLGGGCYTSDGTQTLTLVSIGGTGPRAVKTIHEKGTLIMPSPPPFANPTSS
jgi:hypothetical protein